MYYIHEDFLAFPHPFLAQRAGILAIGGDLTPERLLLAYQFGIFPWYSEGEPIVWWCPNPRFVTYPNEVVVAKSMRSYFNQKKFQLTIDTHFIEVISHCQKVSRKGQMGTWITSEMIDAYIQLHEMGYAHSLEVWSGDELVGGLYGVALGKIFYGESMFSLRSNASKFAFITLCRQLDKWGYWLVDCQQETKHLRSLGGKLVDGNLFHNYMKKNCLIKHQPKKWTNLFYNDASTLDNK